MRAFLCTTCGNVMTRYLERCTSCNNRGLVKYDSLDSSDLHQEVKRLTGRGQPGSSLLSGLVVGAIIAVIAGVNYLCTASQPAKPNLVEAKPPANIAVTGVPH